MLELERYALNQTPIYPGFEDGHGRTFIDQFRALFYMTLRYGERDPGEGYDVYYIDTKQISPTKFFQVRLMMFKSAGEPTRWNIGLEKYEPKPNHSEGQPNPQPYHHTVTVSLESGRRSIDVRVDKDLYPQAADFEEPLHTPGFSSERRELTKELFLFDKWVIRGPIQALGPKTKEFMFDFTNHTFKAFRIDS